MFSLLAEVGGKTSNGMLPLYSPLGIFTLFGIIYLIFCIVLTIYKDNIGLEMIGMVVVFCLWFVGSYVFVFGMGEGLSGRSVVTLNGVEVTAGEIRVVLDYICGTRPGVGDMDDKKYTAIKRHLLTSRPRTVVDLTPSDKADQQSGRCDIIERGDVYKIWELRYGEYGGRLPSDFDYSYKQPGRDVGVPSSVYHPAMWFWDPIIALLISRPLWYIIIIKALLRRDD